MGMLASNRTRMNPWLAPWDMQEDFNRMWDTFNSQFGAVEQRRFTPALDVRETDDAFEIEADIPGMTKDDVTIEVTDNVVSISGERTAEQTEEKKNYHRVERQYGAFRRTVSIPGGFEHDKVAATFRDGVLHITLPKPEARKPRRIEVKTN